MEPSVSANDLHLTPSAESPSTSAEVERKQSDKRKKVVSSDGDQVYDIIEQEEKEDVGFLEFIGSLVLSKETIAVLKGIQSIVAAFGQGLEISNASFVIAILELENFYSKVPRFDKI